jgi:hypothetical protein
MIHGPITHQEVTIVGRYQPQATCCRFAREQPVCCPFPELVDGVESRRDARCGAARRLTDPEVGPCRLN